VDLDMRSSTRRGAPAQSDRSECYKQPAPHGSHLRYQRAPVSRHSV